jgi:hypothetical protein
MNNSYNLPLAVALGIMLSAGYIIGMLAEKYTWKKQEIWWSSAAIAFSSLSIPLFIFGKLKMRVEIPFGMRWIFLVCGLISIGVVILLRMRHGRDRR